MEIELPRRWHKQQRSFLRDRYILRLWSFFNFYKYSDIILCFYCVGRCERCRQPLCTGACQDSKYDQRMRHARSTDNLDFDEKTPPLPPRSPSRGCYSCLRKHNAKLLNANSLLMGRPKSSLATYSRGKQSTRPHKDLRPSSAVHMSTTLAKDFERLGIEPQQPQTARPTGITRPRSRNGLLPGKSSRSNRKNSITESKKKKGRSHRSYRVAQTAVSWWNAY